MICQIVLCSVVRSDCCGGSAIGVLGRLERYGVVS
jgi:hypothetical protein